LGGGRVLDDRGATERDALGRRCRAPVSHAGGRVGPVGDRDLARAAHPDGHPPTDRRRADAHATAAIVTIPRRDPHVGTSCRDVLPVDRAGAPVRHAGRDAQLTSSFPRFCIPPPSDLNCSSPLIVGRGSFAVRQADPHRLDPDRDGVGCERQPSPPH
jgi:hypothetical protein